MASKFNDTKLTSEQIKYYKKFSNGVKLTAKDFLNFDSDRGDSIEAQATMDVATASAVRKASDFKSEAEYKWYVLCVYNAAMMAEREML